MPGSNATCLRLCQAWSCHPPTRCLAGSSSLANLPPSHFLDARNVLPGILQPGLDRPATLRRKCSAAGVAAAGDATVSCRVSTLQLLFGSAVPMLVGHHVNRSAPTAVDGAGSRAGGATRCLASGNVGHCPTGFLPAPRQCMAVGNAGLRRTDAKQPSLAPHASRSWGLRGRGE